MTRWLELALRARTRHIALASFVFFLAIHAPFLAAPPYWDALLGAFPQAHWLAQHRLSSLALLESGGRYVDGGACVYPFSIVPTLIALFELAGVEARASFVVLHVLDAACAASAVAGTWRLARAAIGERLALFVAAALCFWPPFVALAGQMSLDAPLAAAGVFALAWFAEGRLGRAWLAALAALLVKPTGIIVAGALGLASLAAARRDAGERRSHLWSALGHAALGAAFVAELGLARAFSAAPEGVDLFGGFVPLFTRRLWTTPDFALVFALALVAVPFAARRFFVRRANRGELVAAAFLAAYLGLFANYVNVLPRYFLQALSPALVLVAAQLVALGLRERGVAMAAALFALAGAINARGLFYPTKHADWSDPRDGAPLVATDGWLLERSLEYRDDQALLFEIARRAHGFDVERTVFVAPWPVVHALSLPRLGYVDAALRTSGAEQPFALAERAVPHGEVYEHDGRRWQRQTSDAIVWILVPNVFGGPSTRPLAGDEVLAAVEVGRLRAFFVRRAAWE